MIYVIICLMSIVSFAALLTKANELHVNGNEEILAIDYGIYLSIVTFGISFILSIMEAL